MTCPVIRWPIAARSAPRLILVAALVVSTSCSAAQDDAEQDTIIQDDRIEQIIALDLPGSASRAPMERRAGFLAVISSVSQVFTFEQIALR